jgi:hypothetical protein
MLIWTFWLNALDQSRVESLGRHSRTVVAGNLDLLLGLARHGSLVLLLGINDLEESGHYDIIV